GSILADVEQLLRLRIAMIKIHPPHQLLFPNDDLNGVTELEIIYRAAEANGIPDMIHAGTSVFRGARNKYGDPIYVDDVAGLPQAQNPAGPWRPPALDEHSILPGPPSSECVLGHQRHPAKKFAAVFPTLGGDRHQNLVWHRLARPRSPANAPLLR